MYLVFLTYQYIKIATLIVEKKLSGINSDEINIY